MTFKYIVFEPVQTKRRTRIWTCRNISSGATIGTVKWHGAWRQYCFFPHSDTVFSKGCLEDIGTFLNEQMAARRKRRRKREESGL